MKTCNVDHSERDYDAHGSFWRSWTAPCGKPEHRFGRCRAHHEAHIRTLEVLIECKLKAAEGHRRELAELRDETACVGTGNAGCK